MSLETSGIASQSAISAQLTIVQNSQPAVIPPPPPEVSEATPPAPPADAGRGTAVDVLA